MSTWTLVFALVAVQLNYDDHKSIFNKEPTVQVISGFSSYETCMNAANELKGNKELYAKTKQSSIWNLNKEPYGITENVIYAGMKCLEIK